MLELSTPRVRRFRLRQRIHSLVRKLPEADLVQVVSLIESELEPQSLEQDERDDSNQ